MPYFIPTFGARFLVPTFQHLVVQPEGLRQPDLQARPMPQPVEGGVPIVRQQLETPTVPESLIPGLLGLEAVRKTRGVIDTVHMRFYMCGPSDFDLETGYFDFFTTFRIFIDGSFDVAILTVI